VTTITLRIPGKPYTANAERRDHWRATAKTRRRTREHAHLLTLAVVRPGTRWVFPVTVTVADESRTANLRDVGAVAPHVKAVLDGITDSKRIWPDDSPTYLAAVEYLAPTKTGTDALVLHITDAAS